MSTEAALILLSWVVIGLLSFGFAGILWRVQRLEILN
jgi:hypothetical protein